MTETVVSYGNVARKVVPGPKRYHLTWIDGRDYSQSREVAENRCVQVQIEIVGQDPRARFFHLVEVMPDQTYRVWNVAAVRTEGD